MSRFCDCGHPDCHTCQISGIYEAEIAELEKQLAERDAAISKARQEGIDLLHGLIDLCNIESEEGSWQVTLDYDNVQDGARVFDGNGRTLGECYEIPCSSGYDSQGNSTTPIKQFVIAIERAIAAIKGEQHD